MFMYYKCFKSIGILLILTSFSLQAAVRNKSQNTYKDSSIQDGPTQGLTQSESPEPNRSICKARNSYYQDPQNCTCFYHCDNSYRPHYKCCLKGQFFSELISNCDWNDGGVDCSHSSMTASRHDADGGHYVDTDSSVDHSSGVHHELIRHSNGQLNSYNNNDKGSSGSVSSSSEETELCPELRVAYPNEDDCRSFWDCTKQEPQLKSCHHLGSFRGRIFDNVCKCDKNTGSNRG